MMKTLLPSPASSMPPCLPYSACGPSQRSQRSLIGHPHYVSEPFHMPSVQPRVLATPHFHTQRAYSTSSYGLLPRSAFFQGAFPLCSKPIGVPHYGLPSHPIPSNACFYSPADVTAIPAVLFPFLHHPRELQLQDAWD